MFRRIGIFILLLAIAVTGVYGITNYLANVRIGILQNQKTEVERMLEEYSNSLTATKEELNIAITERQELVTTVNNYQTEVTELKSQAIIDTEKLATAEANLATAEQALEDKDAEIAKLKQDLELYELICGMANPLEYDYAFNITDFDFTYEDYPKAYAVTKSKDANVWNLFNFSDNQASNYTYFPSSMTCIKTHSTTPQESLSQTFDYVLGYSQACYELGAVLSTLQFDFEFSGNRYHVRSSYNIVDFLEKVANGNINSTNWVPYFNNALGTMHFPALVKKLEEGTFNYTQACLRQLDGIVHYPRTHIDYVNALDVIVINGVEHEIVHERYGYTFGLNIVIDDNVTANKVAVTIGSSNVYPVIIDKQLDALMLYGYTLFDGLYTQSEYLQFTQNAHIDKLYVPRDFEMDMLREDIKEKITEFIYLPFYSDQLEMLSMY